MGYWVTGLLGYWVTGLLGYWVTGLLGSWVTGFVGYWVTGCGFVGYGKGGWASHLVIQKILEPRENINE